MVSGALKNFFETKTTLEQKPQVIAEWNYNRFADDVITGNSGGFKHSDYFNTESLAKPHRPDSGVSFAFSNRSHSSSSSVLTQSFSSRRTGGEGFYITPGEDMPYTYWVSPYPSSKQRNMGNCLPYVLYDRAYNANKIVVKFEVTWSAPTLVNIHVRKNNRWDRVESNVVPDSKGRIELYYHDGQWTQTHGYSEDVDAISGVRVDVRKMDKPSSYAHVIEIAALRVQNISQDIISFSGTHTREEMTVRSPVGISSANECSIVLDNTTGRYSPSNTGSDLYGMLDRNVKFYVSVVHNRGIEELEKLGEFYSNAWPDTAAVSLNISCSDFIKQLQEFASIEMLLTETTPEFAIRTLLGAYGYGNIVFNTTATQEKTVLPFVWSKKENSLWETITEVLRAAQAALYINENGDFVYESKEWFFSRFAQAARLEADFTNGIQPNIVSWEKQSEIIANSVNVNYTPLVENAEFGIPTNSVLWQPSEAVALASSPLRFDMSKTQKWFYINEDVAAYFPYEGRVNIEGEIIAFRGKEYQFYANGFLRNRKISSHEEKKAADEESDSRYSYLNKFTGQVYVTERGYGGSIPEEHKLAIHGAWNDYRWGRNGSVHRYEAGRSQVDGRVRLKQWSASNYDVFHIMRRGSPTDRYAIYGTQLRFTNAKVREGIAGMCVFVGEDNKSGIFIELLTNDYVSNVRKNSIGNIRCYRINSDQTKQGLPRDEAGIRGYDWNIEQDRDYRVELMYDKTVRQFSLFVDGQFVTSFIDSYAAPFKRGRWGMFVRGETQADFEYFYYLDAGTKVTPEQESIYRQIEGGYASQYLENRIHERNHKLYFMEFGPVVHEIRDFEVDHTIEPALSSEVYMSNNTNAVLTDFNATPFKTKFSIANASRNLAVLNGVDVNIIDGEEIDQQLFVYGLAIILDEEKSVTIANDDSIRRHGKVEVSFSNSWVQTEQHARNIANYIESHWAEPAEIVRTNVVLPPGLKVSDIVLVNMASKGIINKKYAVIGIDYRYESGMTAELTLMSYEV